MLMRDQRGVICTILYGQDNISPVTATTSHVIYVAYAPAGVGEDNVLNHLKLIEKNIRIFAVSCVVEQEKIFIS